MRVLVTGVAGGIGHRVARLLLAADHDVIGVDRDAKRLDAVPDDVETMALDLGDDVAVSDTLGSLPVDAVVSAVGWYELTAIEDCPPAALRDHLESNLVAVHTVVHALLPTLRQREGRVVVVGSMAGAVPLPYHGPYSAAKAGLAGYTTALRREVEPRGVDVALVEPGPARTGFNERAAAALDDADESAYRDRYRAFEGYSPAATEPEEVAETVVEAVEADRPKPRYRVGARARLLSPLLAVLPDRLGDRIVRSGTPGGLLSRLVDR